MKTEILIQARSGSTRLPGKIMLPLADLSLIEHIFARCKYTGYKTVVLTSDQNSDNDFCDFLHKKNIPFFRGPLEDVLDRFLRYLKNSDAENIIRVTGDNPLIDFRKIMEFEKLDSDIEYSAVSGGALGTGSEFVKVNALKRQYKYNMIPEYREHVTLCIRKNSDDFKIKNIQGDKRLERLRLTVDEIDDYNTLKDIYEKLYKGKPIENDEIYELYKEKPDIFSGNIDVRQNKI